MSTFHDERESCHIAYARFLFIKTEGEEVPAPVVILQNDIHNVFGILEKHFHPKYLPQPDKYWKTIRTVLDIDSWRPRVNGCVGLVAPGEYLHHRWHGLCLRINLKMLF